MTLSWAHMSSATHCNATIQPTDPMISAINEDITWYKPRLRAPAVGAQVGKVLRHPQDILDIIVLLASHRQAP